MSYINYMLTMQRISRLSCLSGISGLGAEWPQILPDFSNAGHTRNAEWPSDYSLLLHSCRQWKKHHIVYAHG